MKAKMINCISLLVLLQIAVVHSVEEEKLKLVVQVSRHGQRSSQHILPLAKDPEANLQGDRLLTEKGRQQHFNMGKYIKEKYIQQKQFLKEEYDPMDIYVQSTDKNRTIEGGYLQLLGMYGEQFPELNLSSADSVFKVNVIDLEMDHLLHLYEDNCERYKRAKEFAKSSIEYAKVKEHFMQNYREYFESLTGMKILDFKSLQQLCSYLYWSYLDDLELKFPFSEEDKEACLSIVYLKSYYDTLGHIDLQNMGSYEFLQMLVEFGKVLGERMRFDKLPVFSKYHKKQFEVGDRSTKPRFPKWMHFSAHAESLQYFLEALQIKFGRKAGPGASLFIEFFEVGEEMFVRIIYKNNPEDPEHVLYLPNQSSPSIPLSDFSATITQLLSSTRLQDSAPNECKVNLAYDQTDLLPAEDFITAVENAFPKAVEPKRVKDKEEF